MAGIWVILEFIVALGLLMFVHELGHFLAARLFKVEVEEFGFGFPPKLVKLFRVFDTDVTLNWIPFGAFVRIKGENDPTAEHGLGTRSPWVRLAVFLGGPVLNLVLGAILFTFVFIQTGVPDISRVQIVSVNKNSPAEQLGLQPGDVILSIDGLKSTSVDNMITTVRARLGQEITITYQRGDQVLSGKGTPRLNPPEGEGALGVSLGNPVEKSWIKAIPYGALVTIEQGHQLILLPGRLISGQISPVQARPVGIVGMGRFFAETVARDEQIRQSPTTQSQPAINTLALVALVSAALGWTNLLPIPALDGGRIIFLLPEILFRKRIKPEHENFVHMIGFASLIILMVYITIQDIINPVLLP